MAWANISIDVENLSWDCNARCFLFNRDGVDATATVLPPEEQGWERPLSQIVDAAYGVGDAPLPTPGDLAAKVAALEYLLNYFGVTAATVQGAVLGGDAMTAIGEMTAADVQRFEDEYGREHSMVGHRRAETLELFDTLASLLVVFSLEPGFGGLAGVLGFIWIVLICSHFSIPINTRETQRELWNLRRLVERVVRSGDSGDDVDFALDRLRAHLFARAELAARRDQN